MEKIIHKLINDFTEGVDTYTHNGSTWLIFTESKQWVVELTKDKTLWYNYNFFNEIFSYVSLDVVDNQQYITKWVEDNIINKELTYVTLFRDARDRKQQFEDTLQNGVKKTKRAMMKTDWSVEDTIQNGIKETRSEINITEGEVDDIIQDGVKVTLNTEYMPKTMVEDTIQNGVNQTYSIGSLEVTEKEINNTLQNGVKHTEYGDWLDGDERLDDIIENGVRDTQSNPYENKSWIEGVIKNGVKETKQKNNALLILDTSGRELILESHLVIRDGVKETNYDTDNYTDDVKEVIREGVKETSHRQFLKTYDVKDTIQDGTEHDRWILDGCDDPVDVVLDNGVKITTPLQSREYTGDIDEVLGNGVRNSHPRQYVGGDIVDKVIDKGVIETHDDVYHHKGRIDGVIKNGVKETKTPGNGDLVSYVEWMKENKSNSYPKIIDDVIENGVKKTLKVENGTFTSIGFAGQCENVIENGEKINGTYAGGQRQSEKCKSVVEYGTKNPTD